MQYRQFSRLPAPDAPVFRLIRSLPRPAPQPAAAPEVLLRPQHVTEERPLPLCSVFTAFSGCFPRTAVSLAQRAKRRPIHGRAARLRFRPRLPPLLLTAGP
ncbi:hypothetical protein GCM10010359_15450 [Streptomyces morookaense]|nr:hypothetical protein GCM10010359_15450 [Streptomyces morookaense]